MSDSRLPAITGTLVGFVVVVLVAAIALAIGLPLFKSVTADGKVTYCYPQSYTYHVPSQADAVLYDLMGHREWRPDWRLGQNFRSMDELKEAAAKYGCELH